MERLLCLFAAAYLLIVSSVNGQTVSQSFTIEPGTSFAATNERVPEANDGPHLAPPAARIVKDFAAALELIRRHHVGGPNLDPNRLSKSSINTMLGELDPHSSYFDPTEFGALLEDQESEYSGTGSTISNFLLDGKIETYIIATVPGSAASQAGLRYGDRIISVDGLPVSGLEIDVVRNKVRGPRGTTVRLVVERAAGGITETIALRRDRVVQPTIAHSFMIRDGVGYVDLSVGFSHTTAAELDAAIKRLARSGMRSLVLDLRDNSGGILEQAVKVVERFLPAGSTIISQRGRNAQDNITWRSTNRDPLRLPLVILVNARTASAAEIVAGALQDNDRAFILGQSTFGKGLVQTVLRLQTGSGLTLTTARYYTPSGRSIQRSYANSGAYDYFNHRAPDSTPKAIAESRTTMNRPVRGDSGITPDETTETESFDVQKASLIDPIFFFVRQASLTKSTARGDFRAFAIPPPWNVDQKTLDGQSSFIADQLRYHLALATAGPEAAARSRIEADPDVIKAINALPRAASLSEAARRSYDNHKIKKPARVAFPDGSR